MFPAVSRVLPSVPSWYQHKAFQEHPLGLRRPLPRCSQSPSFSPASRALRMESRWGRAPGDEDAMPWARLVMTTETWNVVPSKPPPVGALITSPPRQGNWGAQRLSSTPMAPANGLQCCFTTTFAPPRIWPRPSLPAQELLSVYGQPWHGTSVGDNERVGMQGFSKRCWKVSPTISTDSSETQ